MADGSGFGDGWRLLTVGWRIAKNGWKSSLLQEMSKEQLKAFQEAVKADTALQKKLKAVQPLQQGADAVVAIAKEAGFVISRDDLCDLPNLPAAQTIVMTLTLDPTITSPPSDPKLKS